MSLHTIGSDTRYILPASQDAVPEAFRSNRMAKPIPCSVQTVNVPALTASASAGGTSIVQIPCGASAGYMSNPYLRYDVQFSGTAAVAGSGWKWKGAVGASSAAIARLSTYVNSVQVDNIQNYDYVMDTLLAHSTSNDWVSRDGSILMGAGVDFLLAANTTSATYSFVIPLIGCLGSQSAFPLFLVNGTLQLQVDWNSLARMFYNSNANATNITGVTFSNVQLCYDRIQPEAAFIDDVRSKMAQEGNKFVYGFTNYQCTSLASGTGTVTQGLNVSSLRGVLMASPETADLSASTTASNGYSLNAGLTQFQVSLDGRLINSITLNSVTAPAVVFAELNKTQGRIFDASISDTSTLAQAAQGTIASGSTYLERSFAVGVSAQRVNEGLAFAGSPVSIVSIQLTQDANYTNFFIYISDFQLLVDSSGAVEIVR